MKRVQSAKVREKAPIQQSHYPKAKAKVDKAAPLPPKPVKAPLPAQTFYASFKDQLAKKKEETGNFYKELYGEEAKKE